jgi:formyltetrahydrofolate-dependent phosphoribosylglycinamide formyltransferase
MFDRLQKKWKVNGLQVLLILCTFAIGGSVTGLAGKKAMNLLHIEQRAIWIIVYILLVTVIWPIAVLIISIPFGQYRFFTGYLKKMGLRMGIGNVAQSEAARRKQVSMIAVFASGAGSNAQKIIDHFRDSDQIAIALIVCNNPGAGVLSIASAEQIPAIIIEKEKFFRGDAYLPALAEHNINFIVLAGFLWKVPDALIHAYPNKIINIHPALLPKFGGKGMYGQHVHAAVLANHESESGITIHYVDGHYDNGDIIFQARCQVVEDDTPETLANRVHQLEHEHYPGVIQKVILAGRTPNK